mgnify:CR=1 FL=1
MTIEERLERMYRKVSRGARSGPDLENMPRSIGRVIDDNGYDRRIYPSFPAVHTDRGSYFITREVTAVPTTESAFWAVDPV